MIRALWEEGDEKKRLEFNGEPVDEEGEPLDDGDPPQA